MNNNANAPTNTAGIHNGAVTHHQLQSMLSVNFNQTILATGGSAVLSDTAMNFLRENSEVIYLEVSYETISERIFNLSERGVVRGPGQSLLETYNERLELYKRYADHVVINNGDTDSCLKEILNLEFYPLD